MRTPANIAKHPIHPMLVPFLSAYGYSRWSAI
jgi:uncharacterized membrane protein